MEGEGKGPQGPSHPWVRDLLGEVGDAVLRAPIHPTVLVPPAEVTVPSTVVPVGWHRQAGPLRGNCTGPPASFFPKHLQASEPWDSWLLD